MNNEQRVEVIIRRRDRRDDEVKEEYLKPNFHNLQAIQNIHDA